MGNLEAKTPGGRLARAVLTGALRVAVSTVGKLLVGFRWLIAYPRLLDQAASARANSYLHVDTSFAPATALNTR